MPCTVLVQATTACAPAAQQRAARPRAAACSLSSPTTLQPQRWAQQRQRVQQRQQRRGGVARLAVQAGIHTGKHGAEWATPKDAYLTVVRA